MLQPASFQIKCGEDIQYKLHKVNGVEKGNKDHENKKEGSQLWLKEQLANLALSTQREPGPQGLTQDPQTPTLLVIFLWPC